ncbi:MAG: MFS transporter [SAR202 cluster bacterium]|nr:MFS transporter [SAR202 cluster bacterium]
MLSLARPAARRLPFYYGWVIATVTGLISFAGVAESPVMVGIFFTPMANEFGWTRTELSAAVLFGTFMVIPAAPLAGRLIDRYGARPVLSIGGTLVAFCLALVGSVNSLPAFYALAGFAFAVNAGIARVSINAVIAQWFVRKRGRAMGIVNLLLGLGFVAMPAVGALVLDQAGWRMGWRALGIATFVMAVPAAVLFLRRAPGDVGQAIDGERDGAPPPRARPGERTAATEVQWTAREAVRTRTFWVLVMGLCTIALGNLGLAVHLVPLLTDRGVGATVAALTFSVAGVTMIPSSPIWGWLLDRYQARLVLVGAASVVLLFTVLAMFAYSAWMVIPLGIAMGIGYGGFGMVQRTIYASYFGRASAGTILGIAVPFQAVAQGSGTVLAGFFFDFFGSYRNVFLLFIALTALSMAMVYLVPTPVKRRPAAAVSPVG